MRLTRLFRKSHGRGFTLAVIFALFILLARPALPARAGVPPVPINKEELAFFLGQSWLERGRADLLRVSAGKDRSFLVQTTLDAGLQHYLEQRFRTAGAPMVALAALDPKSGEVKALVSYDRLPGRVNYALTPSFPAASVFKMVTAAAALEKGGLTPASTIPFHGGSHTLYRSQIKIPEPNANRKATLTESFAGSFNPVFGKLANKPVGPIVLEQFAYRFGFNQSISFELPLSPSRSWVPKNDSYELALSGSGFNRKTTLSPLHGALMAATVLNSGVMMEPTVVERVLVYKSGRLGAQIYRNQPQVLRRSLKALTASRMRALMGATITEGTGRRTFRRAGYDRVLKKLLLGGKTGSINDVSRKYRIDWFVGYGWDRATGKALSLGVVVAHDLQKRGIGSRILARDALRYYFDPSPKKLKARTSRERPRTTTLTVKPVKTGRYKNKKSSKRSRR